jgi:hypothetical protein
LLGVGREALLVCLGIILTIAFSDLNVKNITTK